MEDLKRLHLQTDAIVTLQLLYVHRVSYHKIHKRHTVLNLKILHTVIVHHQVTLLQKLLTLTLYQRIPPLHIIPKNILQTLDIELITSQHITHINILYPNLCCVVLQPGLGVVSDGVDHHCADTVTTCVLVLLGDALVAVENKLKSVQSDMRLKQNLSVLLYLLYKLVCSVPHLRLAHLLQGLLHLQPRPEYIRVTHQLRPISPHQHHIVYVLTCQLYE